MVIIFPAIVLLEQTRNEDIYIYIYAYVRIWFYRILFSIDRRSSSSLLLLFINELIKRTCDINFSFYQGLFDYDETNTYQVMCP